MAKNVALSNEAYRILEKLKRPNESFSNVVIRLETEKTRPDWRTSFGIWKDDKETGKIFGKILKDRRTVRKRRVLTW